MRLKKRPRQAQAQAHAPDPLAFLDASIDSYVRWRDASRAVAEAYRHWGLAERAERAERDLAFDRYAAALDHEEVTARRYRQVVDSAVVAPWRPRLVDQVVHHE
jgi:hypothetical protein